MNLPEKYSEVLRVAIADMEKCVEQGIEIDMWQWVKKEYQGKLCSVCLGGAAMVQTINEHCSDNLSTHNQDRCFFLNDVRRNELIDAFVLAEIPSKLSENSPRITPYEQDPKQFKEDILALANYLEKHGY